MKKRIEELRPGAPFQYCGYNWVKLDSLEAGALVLAADVVFNRAFDNENRADWTISTLREELGNDFANRLHSNGANFENFVSFRPDLTANDGMKNYGSTIDGIALLSCEQYRQYRHVIPQATERWWTLTPWSCTKPYAAYVCAVKRDGTIDYEAACCNDWGVRPACVLENDTLVAVEGADSATEAADNIIAMLGGITIEEAGNALVEASKRIAKMRIRELRRKLDD